MAGSHYLARQAATQLRLAKIARDTWLSAKLAVKVADLEARADIDSLSHAPPDPGIALNKDG